MGTIFTFKIDVEAMAKEMKKTEEEIRATIDGAVRSLAVMTHAKAVEMAGQDLKSLKQPYVAALSFQEIAPKIWSVSLSQSALWIEEGMEPHSMVPNLLKRNAKTAKDGSKYRAIPIGKKLLEKGSQDPRAAEVLSFVKKELKERKIPFRSIEKDAYGNPRLGVLHRIDLQYGKPSPRASHDLLSGLTIVQRKNEKGKVERHLLTFRTVSSKHYGWKWNHPGLKGAKIIDKVYDWALKTWENEILPNLFNNQS